MIWCSNKEVIKNYRTSCKESRGNSCIGKIKLAISVPFTSAVSFKVHSMIVHYQSQNWQVHSNSQIKSNVWYLKIHCRPVIKLNLLTPNGLYERINVCHRTGYLPHWKTKIKKDEEQTSKNIATKKILHA